MWLFTAVHNSNHPPSPPNPQTHSTSHPLPSPVADLTPHPRVPWTLLLPPATERFQQEKTFNTNFEFSLAFLREIYCQTWKEWNVSVTKRNRGISHFPFYYAYFARDSLKPLQFLFLLNLSRYETDDSFELNGLV